MSIAFGLVSGRGYRIAITLPPPPLRSIAAGSLIEPVVCCHIVDVDDNAATSSGAFLHRRSIVEELLSLPLSAGSWLSTIVCFLLTVP